MSCAGQARGSQSSIIIDFETSVYLTPPAVFAAIRMPFLSESLTGSRTQNVSDVINGNRNPTAPFEGNKDVQGSITVPIDKRNFGFWLRALLGDPVTTGAVAPFTHVFSVDPVDCQPSMIIEKAINDIPHFFKYSGVKVGGLSITVGGDGELTAEISLVGATVEDSATSFDPAPKELVFDQYSQIDGVITEGGVQNSFFTEVSIDITSNLDADVFTIGAGGTRSSLPEGKYGVSGSTTTIFETLELYDKARDATESSMIIDFIDGADSLRIEFEEIEFALNDPQIEGPQGIVLNLDFQAFFSDGASSSSMVFTLVNDVDTYV